MEDLGIHFERPSHQHHNVKRHIIPKPVESFHQNAFHFNSESSLPHLFFFEPRVDPVVDIF